MAQSAAWRVQTGQEEKSLAEECRTGAGHRGGCGNSVPRAFAAGPDEAKLSPPAAGPLGAPCNQRFCDSVLSGWGQKVNIYT